MFGLKTFVQIQTFRRVPPVLPRNFCHPDWNVGPLHRISYKIEKKMTIFICNIEEFRCDVKADCDDKSDEVSCQIVHLEPGYFKESAVSLFIPCNQTHKKLHLA